MGGPGDMMDGTMGGWGGLSPAGASINVLLLVGLLALVAWAVVRTFSGQHGGGGEDREHPKDNAEEILRGRFARGEIGAEEYEESLETLREESAQRTYEGFVREARKRG
ncbi:MAG: SHOCT domain-containing protein [Rubrobacter sp.]|nr:SHOCT domain-containing protein [Rubrobacter sp.]